MTKLEIGYIIKEARMAAGMTQMELANALGRPQNTVSAWEVGRAQPDISTLVDLFRMMGRSLDEAFGMAGQKSAPPLSGEALKVAREFSTLDRWGQKMVHSVIENASERVQMEMLEQSFEIGSYFPQINSLLDGKKIFEDGSTELDVLDLKPDTLITPDMPHKRMRFNPGIVPLQTYYGVVVPDEDMAPILPCGAIVFIRAAHEARSGEVALISRTPKGEKFGGKVLLRYYHEFGVFSPRRGEPPIFRAMNKDIEDIALDETIGIHGQVLACYNPVGGLVSVPDPLEWNGDVPRE